ncbi:MAG: threonylcarbamoyl-AMP synthase [Nitrospira sp. CR1.3]|nr:threonylcarbamoyl-AMP synthase [Nitrospira sp. CR1.3]
MATLEPYALPDLPRLGPSIRSLIQRGGLVALPTETFYGLGVNPFDESALDRLLGVKGRTDGKPILVLIGETAQLPLLTPNLSRIGRLLVELFWPGALTILFPAHPSLPSNLTAGTAVVGVRLSPCLPVTELLKVTGPVTGTSANRSGAAPARTAAQVQREFGRDVDLILDAGETPGGLPSTVIDSREPVRLIREGAVPRQKIQNVLQTHGILLI